MQMPPRQQTRPGRTRPGRTPPGRTPPGAPALRRPGFTLVEILAVVTILGIMAAVVVPQIGTRDDLRASSAARLVMSDLLYAQNRAVTLQRTHYVRFDPEAEIYEVLDSMSPLNVISHPVNKNQFRVPLGAGRRDDLRTVTIAEADFDGFPILAFDELGTPFSYDASTGTRTAMAAGHVTLTSNEYQMTIRIEPYSGELTAAPGGP